MGRLQWQWARVRAGQVIRFRYNGKMRISIVLSSPMDTGVKDKNLLHALQIQNAGQPVAGMGTKLKEILKFTGGVILITTDKLQGKFFKLGFGTGQKDKIKPDNVYARLKGLINQKDLYKTFSWKKCKESGVMLDNNELNEYNIPVNYLGQAGETVTLEQDRTHSHPSPKTFKRKAPRVKYKPGQVWQQPSGRWAAKNLAGFIRSYKTDQRFMAEWWSQTKGKLIRKP